jgi:hypothetical protein
MTINFHPKVIAKGPPVPIKICPQIQVEVDQTIDEAERLHVAYNCEWCRKNRIESKTEPEMK